MCKKSRPRHHERSLVAQKGKRTEQNQRRVKENGGFPEGFFRIKLFAMMSQHEGSEGDKGNSRKDGEWAGSSRDTLD